MCSKSYERKSLFFLFRPSGPARTIGLLVCVWRKIKVLKILLIDVFKCVIEKLFLLGCEVSIRSAENRNNKNPRSWRSRMVTVFRFQRPTRKLYEGMKKQLNLLVIKYCAIWMIPEEIKFVVWIHKWNCGELAGPGPGANQGNPEMKKNVKSLYQ